MSDASCLETAPTILDTPVNLFTGVEDTTPKKTFTLAEALTLIQNGTYRAEVQRLQHVLATEGKDRYKHAKERLDAVSFCGTFSPTRKMAQTQQGHWWRIRESHMLGSESATTNLRVRAMPDNSPPVSTSVLPGAISHAQTLLRAFS